MRSPFAERENREGVFPSVPAACDRGAAAGLSELCADRVRRALVFMPRNPDGELIYPRNGRPSRAFSGGGRTDSVEAFAGAQGQRVKRGFEATEKERQVSSRGSVAES